MSIFVACVQTPQGRSCITKFRITMYVTLHAADQGEKIGSISQYRRWLRDQSTFRRKAAHGFKGDE